MKFNFDFVMSNLNMLNDAFNQVADFPAFGIVDYDNSNDNDNSLLL